MICPAVRTAEWQGATSNQLFQNGTLNQQVNVSRRVPLMSPLVQCHWFPFPPMPFAIHHLTALFLMNWTQEPGFPALLSGFFTPKWKLTSKWPGPCGGLEAAASAAAPLSRGEECALRFAERLLKT